MLNEAQSRAQSKAQSKAQKKARRFYLWGGLVCLLFMAINLAFVFWMVKTHESHNREYLYDTTGQSCVSILKQVQGDLQTLTGIATCLSHVEIGNPNIRTVLTEINSNNEFVRMGYADLQGVVDLIDIDGSVWTAQDLGGMPFMRQALAGESTVSETQCDPLTGEDVNYYAVPVWREGKVAGALCAVHKTSVFCKIIDTPLFDGAGYSNVVNSAGEYVIRTRHPRSSVGVGNIHELNLLDNISSGEDALYNLSNGKSGFFEYHFENEVRWVVYQPIGINDWSVVTTVPRDKINSVYTVTAVGVSLLIVLSLGIFSFFVYHIERTNHKNRLELERLAYTDALTGCRSYPKFLEDVKVQLEIPTGKSRALIFCDLKRFKYLNDLMGYGAGDNVLCSWVHIMEERIKEGEVFGRVSEDKFVFLQCYTDENELEQRFFQLVESLSQLELIKAHHYRLEACAGAYRILPGDAISVNDMINRANIAQKSVKNSTGSSLACYTDEMREHVIRETRLEANIEQGFLTGEFEIYPQPQINIQQGDTISGMEALSRWNSAKGGVISPGDFIPLFEKNGSIIRLDRAVFRSLCEKTRQYLDEGRVPLVMACNVSRLGMYQNDFVAFYAGVKEEYHIPDGILELEFTESIVWDNYEVFRQNVVELQAHGFLCAIDDFGSGYSSLNVLKNLPMDILKLDMLFFREDSDVKRARTVIANIITMAKELNMKTVAEGVEQLEQVEFLREIGCDVVQGYVFARPMPMAEFDRLVPLRDEQEKRRSCR